MFTILTKNKSLNTLLFINNIFVLAAAMLPPIFALFVEEIGGDIVSVGSLFSIFAITTGIMTRIISHYGDKFKETEYLIAGGYVLRIFVWIGYFFSNSLWQLCVLQLLLALGESLGTPAFNAIYSKHLDCGNFVKQWGIHTSLNFMVVGIAAMLGGIIVFYLGFRFLFAVMIVLSSIAFMLLMVQPRKLL